MSDDDIRQFIARNDERWERVKDDLDKLKHVLLEGNGTPAMTVQVATMNERLKTLEEDRNDNKVPKHVTVGISVSIILAVASILAGFVNT